MRRRIKQQRKRGAVKMVEEPDSLHHQLEKACDKVDGRIEESTIGVDVFTCKTDHGEISVRHTPKRFFDDKKRVSISDKDSNLSSSTKEVEEIRTSWNRIVAKGGDTTFDLRGN